MTKPKSKSKMIKALIPINGQDILRFITGRLEAKGVKLYGEYIIKEISELTESEITKLFNNAIAKRNYNETTTQ